MQQNIAIAPCIEAPQTPLTNINSSSQPQLVAVWQLDENSQLYCQWVPKLSKQFTSNSP